MRALTEEETKELMEYLVRCIIDCKDESHRLNNDSYVAFREGEACTYSRVYKKFLDLGIDDYYDKLHELYPDSFPEPKIISELTGRHI